MLTEKAIEDIRQRMWPAYRDMIGLEPRPSPSKDLVRFLERLHPDAEAVLDLGAGYGLALAAFSLAGKRAYGVEKDPKTAAISRKNLIQLGVRAVVHEGNYLEDAFWETATFKDGTRPRDMDAFYCFAYHPFNAMDVFHALAKRGRVREGAIVHLAWKPYSRELDREIEEAGFERLDFQEFWIRKRPLGSYIRSSSPRG